LPPSWTYERVVGENQRAGPFSQSVFPVETLWTQLSVKKSCT
jgi:hypothetical protein